MSSERDALNSRIITVVEIINGFKDIAEGKAVGPDGFLKETSKHYLQTTHTFKQVI